MPARYKQAPGQGRLGGVYYGCNAKLNCSYALDGPIQSPSKAELKVRAHVLRTAECPTIVMRDCKEIVGTFSEYVQGTFTSNGQLAGQDLWDQPFQLHDSKERDHVMLRWMPSHLDADKAKASRTPPTKGWSQRLMLMAASLRTIWLNKAHRYTTLPGLIVCA